ncbi:hypothetical protein McanMca71_007955 [Microsporum canis]|uniref:Uncharacterized protein n=1 Tax=Arthroderma otae (strain ATCC MYA-4605 / CBS 113480) TaxID=554155 RepID=C5FK02_ARTOC|nr:uncharacterized protein MCYG_02843 [Microsporum canis CBS 113480]EEQ30024.1 predicted protein [Microsporum canis CBS 113480]
MATSGEETTFPYPDPLFNDWLFKLREYLPGYKGPIFTCEFHNWLLWEGVNVAHPSLFAARPSYEQEECSSPPSSTKLGMSHGVAVGGLGEAGRDTCGQIKPCERLEECYEKREADANALVYIIKRDVKTEEGGGDATQDTQRRTPPSPTVSHAGKAPASQAWPNFAIPSAGHHGIDEQQPSQSVLPTSTYGGWPSFTMGMGSDSQWLSARKPADYPVNQELPLGQGYYIPGTYCATCQAHFCSCNLLTVYR